MFNIRIKTARPLVWCGSVSMNMPTGQLDGIVVDTDCLVADGTNVYFWSENLFLWSFPMLRWSQKCSVQPQIPGSVFIQMVVSCIWENPGTREPRSLPLPSSHQLHTLSTPQFKTTLLFLQLFHPNDSHSEQYFFYSYFYLDALGFSSHVPCVSSSTVFLLHLSLLSFDTRLSFSVWVSVREARRLWRGARSQLKEDTGSPSSPDPCSRCSVHIPPETLVIQI